LFDLSQAILLSGFFFLITIVIVIDFNKQIIFDIFPYIIIIFGLLITFFFPTLNPFQVGILNSLFSVVISFTLFLTIRKVFKKVKKKEGLGLGDAKLVAALSAWTGFENFLYLLIISSLIGIIYYFIVKKKKSQEVRIPFGSALGIGFIILLLY
jgi:leader peptidase (prepilin peptidase)/N-methyltransferase